MRWLKIVLWCRILIPILRFYPLSISRIIHVVRTVGFCIPSIMLKNPAPSRIHHTVHACRPMVSHLLAFEAHRILPLNCQQDLICPSTTGDMHINQVWNLIPTLHFSLEKSIRHSHTTPIIEKTGIEKSYRTASVLCLLLDGLSNELCGDTQGVLKTHG